MRSACEYGSLLSSDAHACSRIRPAADGADAVELAEARAERSMQRLTAMLGPDGGLADASFAGAQTPQLMCGPSASGIRSIIKPSLVCKAPSQCPVTADASYAWSAGKQAMAMGHQLECRTVADRA